jgi:hypothetical protein
MYGLGETFHEITSNGVVRARLEEARVLSIWREVAGPAISENAAPEKIKNGILYIRTKSPAWAQELKVLDAQIKKQINGLLGFQAVLEIRFTHGSVTTREPEEEGVEEDAPDIDPIQLTESELEHAEELAYEIEVDELKEQVMRLLIKSKKLDKWRLHNGPW